MLDAEEGPGGEWRHAWKSLHPFSPASVRNVEGDLEIVGDSRQWQAHAVLSTTGTWRHPFVPNYAGTSGFKCVQIHSAGPFAGQRVAIGKGNPFGIEDIFGCFAEKG